MMKIDEEKFYYKQDVRDGCSEELCRTGWLVPGTREIKESVLGPLPYFLVW